MVKSLIGLVFTFYFFGTAPAQAQPAAAKAPTAALDSSAYESVPLEPVRKKLPPNLRQCPPEMDYIIVNYNPKRVFEACIDRYEYPNQKGLFPRTGMTWYQAKQLCQKQGKYLCSDREWLTACKGLNNWDFSYDNVFDPEKCNVQSEAIHKSGDHPDCKTRNYDVYDMIGNAREWTSGGGIGASGGSFKNNRGARCSRWDALSIKKGYEDVGFRCCVRVNTGRYGKVTEEALKKGLDKPDTGAQPGDETVPANGGSAPAPESTPNPAP